MTFLQLCLRVRPDQEAAALAFVWTLGVNGVEVHDADTGAPPGVLELRVYLDPELGPGADPAALRGAAEAALGAPVDLALRIVAPAPQPRPPFDLGAGFRVYPPGARPRSGRRRPLWIDPDAAWGDGRHGSTRAAVRLLERAPPAGQRALDLGCGSGLLGLVAAALGAELTAVDTDALARRATAAAFAAAGLPARVLEAPPAGEAFDLVIANLPAADLWPALPQLLGAAAPGGALLLSGTPALPPGRLEAALPGWTRVDGARSGAWQASRWLRV